MGSQRTENKKHKVRRQWGSDRRDQPLSAVPPAVSDLRITFGRMAIVLTVCAWFMYVVLTVIQQFVEGDASSARLVIEAMVYLVVITALTASAIAYLITRIGFFYRSRGHRRAPRAAIDHFFTQTVPTVTVLVPSYREDERVIRTTLLSAALQEHPYLRVVLLIDDPQNPTTKAHKRMLEAARALPGKIQAELSVPLKRVLDALERFEAAQTGTRRPTADDMRVLATHYEFAATWLHELGANQEIVDHSDSFFVDHVVGALAHDLATIADALYNGAADGASLSTERLLELYRRLVATFRAEVSSFERKRYVSCSHEANKAMNLNSYIGLMGGSYQEIATPLGLALVPSSPTHADFTIADPDYILTLDADSVLLPEYCARLLYLLEQTGHARVGVAQTPYSSYPGSATRIERIAGATTDLQHIVHQGMTQYDATFWVGANAILRKAALDDIVEVSYEGNWEIRRYIQDRTVIEDTESTIDLGIHGWTLLNYPERLAYSATPPDFGSLCIQRQRWANGGLLILSKLRRQSQARKERDERNRFGEWFLRVNYMASIFSASLCLLIMLIYPFNAGLLKPELPLIALPYFLMMASDLRLCGYKRLDVLRIYGFNLILLPVNLSGSTASILQLVTGEKSSFKRTPKVRNRTTARAPFILAPVALIAFSAWYAVRDVHQHHWAHLFFATLNCTLAFYAMVAFVGVRNAIVDLFVQLKAFVYRPVPAARSTMSLAAGAVRSTSGAIGDWASVLHFERSDVVTRAVEEQAIDATVPASRRKALPDWRTKPRSTDSGAFEEYTFFTVFQPIVDLASGEPVGYEALTRFADGQSPQVSLAAANNAGVGVELDAALARAALKSAHSLPEDKWLAVNVSPGLAAQPDKLADVLALTPCPLVIEISDATDAAQFVEELSSRVPNVMFAIDDAGAGYESLSRIERLRPSFLKLHRESIAGIAEDGARRSFVKSLVAFADEHRCTVIAEGVETEAERDALRDAGVHLAQGYFVGRPVPIDRMPSPAPLGVESAS
jgi:EAL domain-containing protein (putative c-di-GMP-specific phosphodiesterase class I)/cellulose synthase/poly-beta-1,6-N-acetylglucosamine synthase-like glycosyltransferase